MKAEWSHVPSAPTLMFISSALCSRCSCKPCVPYFVCFSAHDCCKRRNSWTVAINKIKSQSTKEAKNKLTARGWGLLPRTRYSYSLYCAWITGDTEAQLYKSSRRNAGVIHCRFGNGSQASYPLLVSFRKPTSWSVCLNQRTYGTESFEAELRNIRLYIRRQSSFP